MAIFGHVTVGEPRITPYALVGSEVLRSVPSLFRLTPLSTARRRAATFAYEVLHAQSSFHLKHSLDTFIRQRNLSHASGLNLFGLLRQLTLKRHSTNTHGLPRILTDLFPQVRPRSYLVIS